MNKFNKAVLIIMDGWGIGRHDKSDAVYSAETPFIDSLYYSVPNTTLLTHGLHVGLPEGQMGNSEVGHLNIGAGRIVYQMLTRIDKAFKEKEVESIPAFQRLIQKAKIEQKNIHLIGLVSDGGVHSSMEHLMELCHILKSNGLDSQTFIHAFTDGRDTDPKSSLNFLSSLMMDERLGHTRIASCVGRYYAMDRDKRWERIKVAYDMMTKGMGTGSYNLLEAIEASHNLGITDEFLEPIVMLGADNKAVATIQEGDIVINFNFRTDRGREITMALTQIDFPEFEMRKLHLDYTTLTEYDKTYENVGVLFDVDDLSNTMGEVLSAHNLTQVRAAETEKYPHVTFFFSGGREDAFLHEKRILMPSPKVSTYDLQPEMSAIPLMNAVIDVMEKESPDFICLNFANADMVGHTGVFPAIIKAVETVDDCVRKIVDTGLTHHYTFLIIADHGNADYAVNEDGTPNTAHTMNPVPCFLVGKKDATMHPGILADVAPTLLKIMGIEKPVEMTGTPLF